MIHYLKTAGILDIIATISLIVNISANQPILDFFVLLKINSILSIIKMLDELYNLR